MSVELRVIDSDGHWQLGQQRFEHLPSPGDRAVIGTLRGLDIWEVLYVEHHPVELPARPLARPD